MGHSGEALILLMPHERRYIELLAGRGIVLQVSLTQLSLNRTVSFPVHQYPPNTYPCAQEELLGAALRWLPPPPEREARNSE
jgi:hypothetical protein